MPNALKQLIDLKPHEFRLVSLSASYFFLLLCAYYILRPIRETMGIARSADDLPYLFLTTMLITLLLAPVIGALVSQYKRSQFIPMAYRFIALNLGLFFIALQFISKQNLFYVGIVFYVWLTVINLLLVSLFWGFMSDGISFDNSKRLFPSIAIGGTAGAILGSSIAQQFIELLGHSYLLLISIVFLELAVRLVKKIDLVFQAMADDGVKVEQAVLDIRPLIISKNKLSEWVSGIKFVFASPYLLAIAGYIFFYGLTSTFLYFQQGILVAEATTNPHQRTQIFANIDILTNVLTLLLQLFVARQLIKKLGIGFILLGLPLFTLAGFTVLSFYPLLGTLIIFQALRRALNYGLFKPAREMLFTLIPSQQKYKAKSFLDTFVYRGGDTVGALSQKALVTLQLGISSIALLVVPIAAVWSLLALYLGVQAMQKNTIQKQLSEQKYDD